MQMELPSISPSLLLRLPSPANYHGALRHMCLKSFSNTTNVKTEIYKKYDWGDKRYRWNLIYELPEVIWPFQKNF